MKRKPRNRYPGVYKTSSGHWRYVIEVPEENGKRRQKSVSLDRDRKRFLTAESARDARTAHIAQLAQSAATARSDAGTLAALLDLWQSRVDVRDATKFEYRRTIDRYIVPSLGEIPLVDLHQRHILQWHDDLLARPRHKRSGTLSPTTIRRAHTILSGALRWAVAMDMVTKNVAALVRPPAAVRPLQRVWSRDDVALFLAATAQQPYGPLWRLLLTTGMRIGEALGLTWADVDLERGTVSIRRTITRDLRGKATLGETTKTPSSLRTIGIPPTVVAALRHQRDAQTFTRRHAGPLWQDHGLVFARWQGGIIAPNTVRAAFERDCKLAGVDPIRLHDLRHTAATLLVESGERLESIRDRLGHRSLATTADLYLSLSVEHDQAVGERLERFIKGLG